MLTEKLRADGGHMVEKVGSVSMNYSYYSGEDRYSDGDVEDEILEIVKAQDSYRYTDSRFNNWAILYHLSRQRENIAVPMEIDKTASVLEIGAGMGAVTGALAEKAGKVTCVELSKRRSLVNAYRHRDMDNIEIYIGNFQDVKLEEQFDVITLIGVLEYANYYIQAEEPAKAFLNQIKGLLKPDGKLYIAIENRLGMKYFAGYNEDHLAKPFVGIEGYEDSQVKTYSYSELKRLLTETGYMKQSFMFPFPDYKLPQLIVDEEHVSTADINFSSRCNFDDMATETFSQLKAFKSLKGDEEIKYFANSFLVEASII
jgi:2-polyprenyl-3-methyl-5-hydroxy-6-metoxy-1,4-benzoquinol methylase